MPNARRASRRGAHRAGSRHPVLLLLALVLVVAAAAVGYVVVRGGQDGPVTASDGASDAVAVPATPSTATPSPSPSPSPSAPAPAVSTPPAPPPPEPVFDRTRYSVDDPASPWVVVNKARPLAPLDFAPADLVPLGSETLAAPAAAALQEMVAAAAAQGLTVTPLSGYRSYDYQQGLYRSAVARLGAAAADVASARAGHSEHQTGFGVDVGGGGCDIEQCFGNTAEGQWVAAESWRYGFMVRYTEAEREVTGFKGEPWHLRWVGVELSTEMHETGIATMEEFFGLPPAPDYPS